jgi:hypothetical protein
VVCVKLPDTPVMVTVTVPVVAVPLAVNVSVLVEVVGFGANAAVTPLGNPDALKVTLPLKPPVGLTVIVLVPLLPCVIVTEVGDAERVKFGGAFTVRLRVVVCVKLPDTPVMVTVTVPVAAVPLAVNVSVLVEVVGFGTNAAVTPLGKPDALKVTLPLKPFTGTTVIVLVPLLPCVMVTLFGEAVRLKSGVTPPQPGNLKLPIAVLQLKPLFAPVVFKYSSLNQKVQSSVGSTVIEV